MKHGTNEQIKKEFKKHLKTVLEEIGKEAETENKILRYLLWLNHGCLPHALYGDDGEMQCGACMIDFKRNSAERIRKRFSEIGMKRFKKEMEEKEKKE